MVRWTNVADTLYQLVASDPARNRSRFRVSIPADARLRVFSRLEAAGD
jgi:hypothetical protein